MNLGEKRKEKERRSFVHITIEKSLYYLEFSRMDKNGLRFKRRWNIHVNIIENKIYQRLQSEWNRINNIGKWQYVICREKIGCNCHFRNTTPFQNLGWNKHLDKRKKGVNQTNWGALKDSKVPNEWKAWRWHQNSERSQGIGSSVDLPSQQTNIQEKRKRLYLHHATPNSYPKFKSEPVYFQNPAVSLCLSGCIKSQREREREREREKD